MAIQPSNIQLFLSGGATNTSAAASLGGVISSTQVVSNAANNLFDDVAASESAAGATEHRCAYLKNTHTTLTLTAPIVVWFATQTGGGHTFSIGLDVAAVGTGTGGNAATTVASPGTAAPANVTFSSPTSKASSTVSIASMAPGQVKAIWFKRVVAQNSAAAAFTPVIQFEGTTLP